MTYSISTSLVNSISLPFAKTMVNSWLNKIQQGCLHLKTPTGNYIYGDSHANLRATLTFHSDTVYQKLLFSGDLGFAEAYINQQMTCSNLTNVIRIFILNRKVIESAEKTLTIQCYAWLQRLQTYFKPNTRRNAKQYIHFHYDLSNQFFKLMLDSSMMYSAGKFNTVEESLEQASYNKIDQTLEQLDLQPQHHLLEIGSGWGTLAIEAYKKYKCRVTTTTISDAQYHHIQKRLQQENLSHVITLLKKDYRDLTGTYDRIVSIEMIEAIGHKQYKTFFKTCEFLLKKDGLMLIQSILIRDHVYERSRNEVDFIKKRIFPGSCIPSLHALLNAAAHTDLTARHIHDLTLDYALTLQHWKNNIAKNQDNISTLGFDKKFLRIWHYYLCYCEAGFFENAILDQQIIFSQPLYRESRYEQLSKDSV